MSDPTRDGGPTLEVAVRRVGTAAAELPAYQSIDAAGCDLFAALAAPMVIEAGI